MDKDDAGNAAVRAWRNGASKRRTQAPVRIPHLSMDMVPWALVDVNAYGCEAAVEI